MSQEQWAIVLDGFDFAEQLRTTLDVYGPYTPSEVDGEVRRITAWSGTPSFTATYPGHTDPGVTKFRMLGQRGPASLSTMEARRPVRPTVTSVVPATNELWDSISDSVTPDEVWAACQQLGREGSFTIPDDVRAQVIRNRDARGGTPYRAEVAR